MRRHFVNILFSNVKFPPSTVDGMEGNIAVVYPHKCAKFIKGRKIKCLEMFNVALNIVYT